MARLNLQPQELKQLSQLLNVEGHYQFLGYSLDLESAEFYDLLEKELNAAEMYVVTVLLRHYLQALPAAQQGKLVKFEQLPGGQAYGKAFTERAIAPIAQNFGSDPYSLVEAAQKLGGKQSSYGDVSVEIPTLRDIPLVYVLWAGGEFPSVANVLFYESASSYLPTEDLAVLGELVSHRLLKATQL